MKTIFALLLIFTSGLTFGQAKDKYDQLYDSLIVLGEYDKIITIFEKELVKQPKSEEILRKLGFVNVLMNNLDQGEKYYLQALNVNPKCGRCYANLGRIYALREDNKKALEYFNKAVDTDPTDALLYANRAQMKEMMGDGFGASRDYDKVIDLDSTNSQYYVNRALYNSKAGYPSMALVDFERAIALSPTNANHYFDRASLYYEQRKLEEALIDMNKAIKLEDANYSFYIARGAIYAGKQQYEKSVIDYNKAISLNKTDYLTYLNRASSYYHLEQMDSSCTDYSFLKMQIDNGNVNNPIMIKEIMVSHQDICDPSKPSYYYQRGVGFYNLAEYEKSLAIYQEGLALFPNNAMILAFKGNTYLAINEYQKALDSYQLSLKNKENYLTEIKLNPRFSEASPETISSFYEGSIASTYYSIAECKVNLGDFDEALIDINTALKLVPNIQELNKETYFNLRGYIYLMKGKYDLAILDFDKSINVNKSFPLAYVNRAIAKVSIAEKVKISSYAIRGNLSNQPLNLNWNAPNKSSLKRSETNILSALADCNSAINIEENLGFAFYIRGQIKQMLGQGDACLDLLRAKELGLMVEAELLRNCM
jgi:tetratricopeptide (TPR) repeat protein